MDVLFYLLLGLSVPVFYIIGLVEFIRMFTHGRKQDTASAALQLRQAAAAQAPDVAKILTDIADKLDVAGKPFSVPGAAPVAAQPAAVFSVPGPGPAHADTAPAQPAAAPAQPVAPPRSLGDLDVLHSLDNINLLLYLGAFLVVVSAGIFVGYNFTVLSGVFKTVFLALFAAIFYVAGLVLFLKARKLRPAGVTFTAIGLVLLPLVGLAAYNFTWLHSFGPATWFLTSLITLAAYITTLLLTRQTYVAYLMAFTTLSVFESSVSLFNLPLHWFGWAMALTSILLLTITRNRSIWQESAAALQVSANIFLPVSLALSVLATSEDGLTQLGVTIALAGVFYAALAARNYHLPDGAAYWAGALLCLPAAMGVGLWQHLSRPAIAGVMLVVGAGYLLLVHTQGRRLSKTWLEPLAFITGLLPLTGVVVAYDHPGYIAAILAATVFTNAYLALRLRQSGYGLLVILSLLALPVVFIRGYLDPSPSWSWVAVAELGLAPVLWWWSRRIKPLDASGGQIGAFGYFAALVLALGAGYLSSNTALMYTAYAVTLIIYGLSALDRRPAYLYAAAASFYLAMAQAGASLLDPATTVLLLAAAGAGIYALGWAAPSPKRAEALRYSGIVGPFLGVMAGLELSGRHLEPVVALAVGGALLLLESMRQSNRMLQEISGGILLLALNWLTTVQDVTQTQAYTLPWAAYAAYLGYRRAGGRPAYDGFTVAALGILTLPLAGQALETDGQIYGLLLIAEAVALVFAGMALSYRLVTIWGVATLVAEVLYQLRDFFYALPKYLISAGLGLALLAVAIVLLQRRKGGE